MFHSIQALQQGMFYSYHYSQLKTCCRCSNVLHLQATEFAYTLPEVRLLKDSIADAIVKHVTVGLVKTVAQLSTMCTQPDCRLLHLLEGARARSMGFDISDGFNNRKRLSVFDVQLQLAFLKDNLYMPLSIMGAVAEAVGTNIVVWVQHPQSGDRLVVHDAYQVRLCMLQSALLFVVHVIVHTM